MERKKIFYGTPLSQSLRVDPTNQDGPINQRKARLNSQQTVRDNQGRQRFHGAFTGGFSAGYFNTVDTVEGFKPRQFVVHRQDGHVRRDKTTERFSHRPEDYMDDEDLGEFGIAPKKLRVNTTLYSDERIQRTGDPVSRFLRPGHLSIGEKILGTLGPRDHAGSDFVAAVKSLDIPKENFHGLGYKPIIERGSTAHRNLSNPLIGTAGGGKRIQISGEAFGTGVLDDDEDFDVYDHGYDKMEDYDLKRGSSLFVGSTSNQKKPDIGTKRNLNDHFIPGFSLASRIDSCDSVSQFRYVPPRIPDSWVEPRREKPYVPPLIQSADQIQLKFDRDSSSFSKKFTSATCQQKCDHIEAKSGLLHYSDLKAAEIKDVNEQAPGESTELTHAPTIVRHDIEWRPCGLLCKRFNVPNPFPDSKFVGTRETDLSTHFKDEETSDETSGLAKPRTTTYANLELRKSIFNVIFHDYSKLTEVQEKSENDRVESDEEPQVVVVANLSSEIIICSDEQESANVNLVESQSDSDHEDIEVVATGKPEPELIVLSSSSSSSPPSETSNDTGAPRLCESSSLDLESYGPPLPPTLRKLIDSENHHSKRHRDSSKEPRKKKRKKKKRHKA